MNNIRKKVPELIVALDLETLSDALDLVDSAGSDLEWYKVGSQLFCTAGPEAVNGLKKRGKKVFLDLKFHDIPNTVAKAVEASAKLGVDMINVHAAGGREMMEAAVKAAAGTENSPIMIAVTVLTSMNQSSLSRVLNRKDEYLPSDHVSYLAVLAKESGMRGVVASAHEIDIVKNSCGDDFLLVVPGIRPAGAGSDDQKRIMTPSDAAGKGADYIVVGRPITRAADPAEAARAIIREISG